MATYKRTKTLIAHYWYCLLYKLKSNKYFPKKYFPNPEKSKLTTIQLVRMKPSDFRRLKFNLIDDSGRILGQVKVKDIHIECNEIRFTCREWVPYTDCTISAIQLLDANGKWLRPISKLSPAQRLVSHPYDDTYKDKLLLTYTITPTE